MSSESWWISVSRDLVKNILPARTYVDFWLASGEGYGLGCPRKGTPIKRLHGDHADGFLLIKVEPPLAGERFGIAGDVTHLVIAARHTGTSLFPIKSWPTPVNVGRPLRDDIAAADDVKISELQELAGVDVFRTEQEARASVPHWSEAVMLERTLRNLAGSFNAFRLMELYQALLDAPLCVPVKDGVSPGGEGESLVEIVCKDDKEGYPSAYVFTNEAALLRHIPEGHKYIEAPGSTVFSLLAGAGVASLERVYVNPDSDDWAMLGRAEFEALARGRVPAGSVERLHLALGSDMKITRPAIPLHPEVGDFVKEILAKEPAIAFAYMPDVCHAHSVDGPKKTLVVVMQDPRRTHEVSERVLLQLKAILSPGQYLDVLPLSSDDARLAHVFRTGSCLQVNDKELHERCLGRFGQGGVLE